MDLTVRLVACAIAVCLAAGCGGTTSEQPKTEQPSKSAEPAPDAKCVELDKAALKGVATGAIGDVVATRGYGVKLSKPADRFPQIRYAVALELATKDGKAVAVMGMGEPVDGGGPVFAADEVAQKYYDWGADIVDNSPADEARLLASSGAAADQAKECLAQGS